jgi:hypothetical protein
MDAAEKSAWARLELIRWKLKHGQLPRDSAQRMWAGYGHGQLCSACGTRIDENEVEYELEFTDLERTQPVYLHRTCCDIWNVERMTFNAISGAATFRCERVQ